MALVLADRVKETSTTTGTGTLTLAGAAIGFQSFAVIGNGNTCYYTITNQAVPAEWEVGIGTYTSAGTTLARTTILASSNAGSVVTLSAGTKDVFVTYPAGKAIYQDANGVYIPASPTFNGNAVISDNSANAALRITQIGAGNSILVEDSANPDATPFVVDAAGRVGIGTTTVSATNLEAVSTSAAIVARGSATTSSALVGAVAHDYYSAPSFRGAYLQQYSSAATGTTLGFANANLGFLAFQNIATNALIYTNGGTAIVFGTNSADRGRVSSAGVWSLGAAPGAESLRVTPVASAVNYLEAQGQIATGGPSLIATGSDTNVPLLLKTKGTGTFNFYTSLGTLQFLVGHTASAVNYLQVTGATTTNDPTISAVGTDTNIDVQIVPKGTGGLRFAGPLLPNNLAGTSGQVLTSAGAGAVPTWQAAPNKTTTGLWENAATISTNYSITAGNNAVSAGPVTIAAGVVVTVPSGSVWAIV